MDKATAIIVAVAAVLVASTNIWNWIKNNVAGGKKVANDIFEKQFEVEWKEHVPALIEQGNKQLMTQLQPQLDVIRSGIEDNNDRLDLIAEDVESLKEQIVLLNTSSQDVMRKEMIEIYRRGKTDKRIGRSDLATFNQLFKDYVAEGGNSYLKQVNDRIQAWEVYEDY